MSYLDYEFFEAFKQLDKLCKEIYGDPAENRLGVTNYLDEMDEDFYRGRALVMHWDEDYRMLKRARHIRNEMAHSCDTFDGICTQEDLDFVREFRMRIFEGTDPLAVLKRALSIISEARRHRSSCSAARSTEDPQECGEQHDDNDADIGSADISSNDSQPCDDDRLFHGIVVALVMVIIGAIVVGGFMVADTIGLI